MPSLDFPADFAPITNGAIQFIVSVLRSEGRMWLSQRVALTKRLSSSLRAAA